MRMPFWTLTLAFMWPRVVWAHGLSPEAGDFYAAAQSLLTGPEDILTWLALGLFAGLHAMRRAGWSAECFAAGLAFGLLAARAGWLPAARPGIDLVAPLVCGVLLALAVRLPALALWGLAAASGLVRGWHTGMDTLARPDGLALASGLGLAGYLSLLCAVAATGWFLGGGAGWRLIAVRAAGSWIAAIALMTGGLAVRRLLQGV